VRQLCVQTVAILIETRELCQYVRATHDQYVTSDAMCHGSIYRALYNSAERDKERTVSSLLVITRFTWEPHQTDSSTPCSSIHHCVASSANNNPCSEVSHNGSFDSTVMMFCVSVPVLLEHNMSVPASSSVDANRDTMFQPDILDIRTCSLELLSNCNHTLLVQLERQCLCPKAEFQSRWSPIRFKFALIVMLRDR